LTVEDDEKFKTCLARIEDAIKSYHQQMNAAGITPTPISFYHVSNPHFVKEVSKIEKNHPQYRKAMKIGVILSRKGQVEPQEMFLNGLNDDRCSDAFWTFMDHLGKPISLSNWTNYRGDMGHEGETYYTQWKNIEIIYHVAPMLGAEEHRRLIGNDVAVIFFHEEGEFDASHLDKLGTVPQIFIVVSPAKDNYRIASFSNGNIKQYGPPIPVGALNPEETKELVLTKLYNGLMMTTYCPPLNRLFYLPRNDTLEAIVAQFPEETRKEYRKFVMGARFEQFTVEEGWFKVKIDYKGNSEEQDKTRTFNSKNCLMRIDQLGQFIVILDVKTRETLYYWHLTTLSSYHVSQIQPKMMTLEFIQDRREIWFISPEERKKV